MADAVPQQETFLVSNFEDENKQKATKALEGKTQVALDLEGVDLGRHGTTCILQLATEDTCFLFDVLGKEKTDPMIVFLKEILESDTVVKIIHDCRMDSDALWHHYGIALKNVHDTSAWHHSITSLPNKNLNDTLTSNGLRVNAARDNSVYDRNPDYWQQRPVTAQMIKWATGDVESLFKLYNIQKQKARGVNKSQDTFLDMRNYGTDFVTVSNAGLFFGRGGQNVRSIQTRTGTFIYNAPRKMQTPGKTMLLVYFSNQRGMDEVAKTAKQY